MRALVYADPHWSTYSSIIRSRDVSGSGFSTRLNHLIDSMNWVEDLSNKTECDIVVCLGDFFDSETLSSEELTALAKIHFNENAEHIFLAGNHEMSRGDNLFSSAFVFGMNGGATVVNKPQAISRFGVELCFIPYLMDKEIVPSKYFGNKTNQRIIFSHNDLKGVNYGAYTTTSGVDMDDAVKCSDLFLNGHIHNGSTVRDSIVNVGNLVGQNFSEDAKLYDHRVAIIETNDFCGKIDVTYVTNPYAFNFYAFDFTKSSDSEISLALENVKHNPCLSIRAKEEKKSYIESVLPNDTVAHRFIIEKDVANSSSAESTLKPSTMNHLEMFSEYILSECSYPKRELVEDELHAICR